MKKFIKHNLKYLAKTLFKDDELRNRLFSRFYSPKIMKLGVSYSVWDGEELLEASIKSIRSQCDYINVVWQKISWFGEPCNEGLEALLIDLKDRGLIDEIIFFEPDLDIQANVNEINKRNLGLEFVKKAGCTHFLTMDADEFYKEEEFFQAKDLILRYQITHTICNIYNYEHINLRNSAPERYFVPFINKIDKNSKLVMNSCSPVPWYADPIRQIPMDKYSIPCALSCIVMHHYSAVRKDLKKKYRNSSANLNQEKQIEFLEQSNQYIQDKIAKGKAVPAENIFNINI